MRRYHAKRMRILCPLLLAFVALVVTGLNPIAAQADGGSEDGATAAEVLSAIDAAVPGIAHTGAVNVDLPPPPSGPAFPQIDPPAVDPTLPTVDLPEIDLPDIELPNIQLPQVSVEVSDVLGAHIDAPLDPEQTAVLAPDDATSVPFHSSVRDIEVDDPEAALEPPAGEEEPQTADEPVAPDPPTADDLAATPPSVASRTIGVNIPSADGAENGVVAEPGLVVYQNTAASTSQAIQTVADGATRFLSVLSGPDAPTEFRYDLSLPSGAVIEPQTDGSLIVWGHVDLDGGRFPLARIAAPWAYDAQHKALPASFTVDGHTVVLHVTHTGATYPVVADPELFFFHYYSPSSPYAEGGSLYGSATGKFTSQVNYANMSRLTMQWGFQLSFAQRNACSYHKASEFARAAVFKRMTRYKDTHPNTSCDYTFHSSMSKYTYADDQVFPTDHYLRGRIGMPLSLWISVQFQTGPRSVRQINVYADYVL